MKTSMVHFLLCFNGTCKVSERSCNSLFFSFYFLPPPFFFKWHLHFSPSVFLVCVFFPSFYYSFPAHTPEVQLQWNTIYIFHCYSITKIMNLHLQDEHCGSVTRVQRMSITGSLIRDTGSEDEYHRVTDS